MADVKISGLPASTTPLAGTEVLPVVQGGQTRQVSVTNLTAGKYVTASSVSIGNTTDPGATNLSVTGFASASSFRPTSSSIPTNGVYLPAANSVGIATNSTNAVYINSSQNVGIGSSNPANKVEIQQNGASTSTAIALSSGVVAGLTVRKIALMSAGGNPDQSIDFAFTDRSGSNAGYITFNTTFDNLNKNLERMRIFNTGGVSIGNTVDRGAASLNVSGLIFPQQAAAAPGYVKGAIYFDTTLNKLRVGGATGWETITSV